MDVFCQKCGKRHWIPDHEYQNLCPDCDPFYIEFTEDKYDGYCMKIYKYGKDSNALVYGFTLNQIRKMHDTIGKFLGKA